MGSHTAAGSPAPTRTSGRTRDSLSTSQDDRAPLHLWCKLSHTPEREGSARARGRRGPPSGTVTLGEGYQDRATDQKCTVRKPQNITREDRQGNKRKTEEVPGKGGEAGGAPSRSRSQGSVLPAHISIRKDSAMRLGGTWPGRPHPRVARTPRPEGPPPSEVHAGDELLSGLDEQMQCHRTGGGVPGPVHPPDLVFKSVPLPHPRAFLEKRGEVTA